MARVYEIVWTEPAAKSLDAIMTSLAEISSSRVARVGESIVRAVEVLRSFPFIGSVYRKGPGGSTREIASKQYRIFYRVVTKRKQVQILAVWHGARDELEFEE